MVKLSNFEKIPSDASYWQLQSKTMSIYFQKMISAEHLSPVSSLIEAFWRVAVLQSPDWLIDKMIPCSQASIRLHDISTVAQQPQTCIESFLKSLVV